MAVVELGPCARVDVCIGEGFSGILLGVSSWGGWGDKEALSTVLGAGPAADCSADPGTESASAASSVVVAAGATVRACSTGQADKI